MSNKKLTGGKKKAKKKKKISYHKQPEDLSLRDWQLALRKQFGQSQSYRLENQGDHPVWSDFTVINPEKKTQYRLAIRGLDLKDNFCSCYDFRTNRLGTCKHIEWALQKLYNTWGNKQYFRSPIPLRSYSSLSVDYQGERPQLRLRLPQEASEEMRTLANRFFDADFKVRNSAWPRLDEFLQKIAQIDPDFRCYPDATDLIIQKREDKRRSEKADRLEADENSLDGLINATLYPYQREGVLFAFRKGRALIGDEMGLGKTLQAIAAAELLQREMGLGATIIVCPTSLKYQWKAEIERFTNQKTMVVEGGQTLRRKQYQDIDAVYKIVTYNVVARDLHYINTAMPDLIILDEAQRIKNYDTKISHAVKRLEAPYRIALTGTPLENKLEDIYSIAQFVDQYQMGPLYKLLARHEARDEHGAVRGYRFLDEVHEKLKPIMIRRLKKEVAHQLPERVDQNRLVPMTPVQFDMHEGYASDVAQLVAKWKRHGYLREKDRQRLMSCLTLMRMSCDSTFLIDQVTRHDTKIQELFYILEEYLVDPDEKVVIFSQWERMTRIVSQELDARQVRHASLHGGVPSKKRGDLLKEFREEPDCRVFLSTDAGGVGLNLQSAALVINLDLPWNPAVLEQRIARSHRLGQKKRVQVINLISEGTIEHRMVHRLRFKSNLAEAVLDTGEEAVFMSDRKFADFMKELENVQQAPISDHQPAPAGHPAPEDRPETPTSGGSPTTEETMTPASSEEKAPQAERQPQSEPSALVSDGVSFLTRLTQTLSDTNATEALVNELTETDETGQTYVKIPVGDQAVVGNALKLLGALFGK
ncbi:MAG: SNF2-related protein [Bacteroidota bacterium]